MYMNYTEMGNNGVIYTGNFKNHYIPARMHNQRNYEQKRMIVMRSVDKNKELWR
jgi:hypothetical protein